MSSVKFKFTVPTIAESVSSAARIVLQLAGLTERLALEDRTLVGHVTGRIENVAEHSNMLAIIAPVLAEEFYPDIDANLVARYATIHDIVEAYVGDTPTHDIDTAGQISKAELEARGLEQLKLEYSHLPKLVALVKSYEQQQITEARFVRVVDKLMPSLMHFAEGGTILRSYISKYALLQNSAERAAWLRRDYGEFEALIALREELSQLMVDRFL